MKAVLYARVSTDDKGQDPLNQLRQMREFATKQSYSMVQEYVDRASGKNGDRPQFRAMMRDAARGKFDVVLFWSLDRLTREGTWNTLSYLRQLSDAGVKLCTPEGEKTKRQTPAPAGWLWWVPLRFR